MPPLTLAAGGLSVALEQLRPQLHEGQLGAQAAFALALWAWSGMWSARRAANKASHMAEAQPAPVLPPNMVQSDWTVATEPRAGYAFLELDVMPAPRFIHPSRTFTFTPAGAAPGSARPTLR